MRLKISIINNNTLKHLTNDKLSDKKIYNIQFSIAMADGYVSICVYRRIGYFTFPKKKIISKQKDRRTNKPKRNGTRNMDYINTIRLDNYLHP